MAVEKYLSTQGAILLAGALIAAGLFFGLRSPGLALADVALLWCAVAATLWSFGRVSALAGCLLAPYLLWVSYAAALNGAIRAMNP